MTMLVVMATMTMVNGDDDDDDDGDDDGDDDERHGICPKFYTPGFSG